MKHSSRIALVGLFGCWLTGSQPLWAQQAPFARQTASQFRAWYVYIGDHKFTDKWGVHVEGQIRRADLLPRAQQLLLRTALNYHFHERAFASAGYCFIETYPYGAYPVSAAFPEHRTYQQLQVSDKLGRVGLVHRYRLEQRWQQFRDARGEVYTNRFRYFLRATLPLQGTSVEAGEWYLTAHDEIFVNFTANVQYNLLDQNRVFVGVGYAVGKAGRLEVGYMNQWINRANGNTAENNHTFRIDFLSTLPFFK